LLDTDLCVEAVNTAVTEWPEAQKWAGRERCIRTEQTGLICGQSGRVPMSTFAQGHSTEGQHGSGLARLRENLGCPHS
jgi:hypothetical protein